MGAGPGDPGLITVRGMELLRRADVVVHDRLIAPALLREARPLARLIDVGKTPRGEFTEQDVINGILIDQARAGHIVVRLKGGDPVIFGRGWEEREACIASGVPCEIVPGISSALAGPLAADIPVTRRGVAATLAIAAAPVLDDARLAGVVHADTCVFLMGMHDIVALTERLIAAGRDPGTPAAVIERATLPGQRSVRGRLDEIADLTSAAGLQSPAIIVLGETAARAKPQPGLLSGKRIVVTRPVSAAQEITQRLQALGAEVISCPLIEIAPRLPDDPTWPTRLASYDWIVFTSRHAVRGFRQALEMFGGDTRRLGAIRIAAVGPITSRELEAWGLRPDLVATPARADTLVRQLLAEHPAPGRVLFPCGTLAADSIPATLTTHGTCVESVSVYETQLLPLDPRIRDEIVQGVDAILFASPSAVLALGRTNIPLGQAQAICIGAETAAAATQYNWANVLVSDAHSDEGMVDLLVSLQCEA